jgi:hypothetical protein
VHAARAQENEFQYEGERQFRLWSEIKGVSRPLYVPCASNHRQESCGLETAKPVVKQGRKAIDLQIEIDRLGSFKRCPYRQRASKIQVNGGSNEKKG